MQAFLNTLRPYVWRLLIYQYLVYVAPAPVFAGLKRLDDWMVCSVEVFRGMFVLR
jgi:hypothetical protein